MEELKIKNPNVCVIGKYVDSHTKIEHKCLIHNITWMNAPVRMLMGVGCIQCQKDKIHESKTRTHDEYIEELKNVNPDIIPLEKYNEGKIPILHYCKKHKYTWNVMPEAVLHGHGCPDCGKEKTAEKNKIPFDQYKEELQSKFPNIDCIDGYVNRTTPALHKCKLCGYEWITQPTYVLNGIGCKKCNKTIRRTHDEYVQDLKEINPHLEVLGTFINTSTHILHRCKIHDYTWNVVPSSILSGIGCPLCGKEKLSLSNRKTHAEFQNELYSINPDIICVGDYVGSSTKIKVQCLKCGCEWEALPLNLLRGHGCPACNFSHGETAIKKWLDDHNIDYVTQKRFKDCKDKRTLPFDFYIPTKNAAIEYDGEQHYKPIDWFGGEKRLNYVNKHDRIKTEYCNNNNIQLLRIAYNDNIPNKLSSFFI